MTIMENKQLYLQTDLKLNDVASELKIEPHKLSQTINSKTNSHFYDFINGFRVDQFKLKLQDESQNMYSVLAIGMDCGFSSKASMNRIFKNHTGMTPTQFQNDKK